MEIMHPDKPKWVKLEIGEEERVACSQCGELVSDQKVELKLDMQKKIVVWVECEECIQKFKQLLKAEAQSEGDR